MKTTRAFIILCCLNFLSGCGSTKDDAFGPDNQRPSQSSKTEETTFLPISAKPENTDMEGIEGNQENVNAFEGNIMQNDLGALSLEDAFIYM